MISFRQLAWTFVLVVVILDWLVYSPAFHRVFSADQVDYLAELRGSTSLKDGLHYWDYGVSRHYMKGDELLFRPLLFVWLAISNWLFGYHYVEWNITNFLIHLVVVFLLFTVLSQIQRGIFAALFALWFSVMMPPVELVLWNHLGGYMISFAFLLVSIWAAEKLLKTYTWETSRYLTIYLIAMTISCLFYECILPISVLFGAYIVHQARKIERAFPSWFFAILLLPAIVFASFYLIHYHHTPRFSYVDRVDHQNVLSLGSVFNLPVTCFGIVTIWTTETLLPSLATIYVKYNDRITISLALSQLSPLVLINAFALALSIMYLVRGVSLEYLKKRGPFALVCILSIITYALILSVGRTTPMIDRTSYYLYYFSILFVLGVYCLLDFKRLDFTTKLKAVASLGVLIFINAFLTASVSNTVYFTNTAGDHYLSRLALFIDEHRNEQGFSFAVKNPSPDLDPIVHLTIGYPDQKDAPVVNLTLSQILYCKFYNPTNPRYLLDP